MYSACPNSHKSRSPTDSILLNLLEERRSRSRLPRHESVNPSLPAAKLTRDRSGDIVNVKIGRWRVLSSDVHRRIVEVRELGCQRVVVRIELEDPHRLALHCTIWELYDQQGHLLSMLQDMGDREVWLTTGFQHKQQSR